MNGKNEEPPGVENLTDDELTSLANNLRLHEGIREVFSAELALRRLQGANNAQATPPERAFEVQCRSCLNKSEVRVRLPKGVKLSANFPFTCRECVGDRSVLDAPKEIEKVLEGKLPGQKRRIYETLASTRASRGPYIVDYANGEFGISEGGYKPYRREKVRQIGREWRENSPPGREAEYKRRYRRGDRRKQFRAVPVDAHAADAALNATLEECGFACSTPGCGRPLTLKTAIRWREGATDVPICRRCLGKKAAEKRWTKSETKQW